MRPASFVAVAVLGLSLASTARAQDPFAACTVGSAPGLCGWVEVPEDRTTAGSRTLRLRVVVATAPDSIRHPDPVALLLGGPGGGAASAASSFAGPLRGLFSDRDIVFLDQRGTGASNGLFCPGDRPIAVDDPDALFGNIFPADGMARCRELLEERADLTKYLTPDAADDLVAVLNVLGYRQADLLGLSYGTRMAQVFARRHPSRVRTLVLSGVMSFDIRPPLHYATDAQSALDRVLDACRAHEACGTRYPRLADDVRSVWAALDAHPVEVSHRIRGRNEPETVTLRKGDVGYAVRGMLYTVEGQEEIPAAFTAAAEGDWSIFVEQYLQRRIRFFATGMHLSVLCSEEVRSLTDDDVAATSTGTFLGGYIADDMRAACARWPLGTLPAGYHQPFTTDVPVLLLSGEYDPVTPPRWAEALLEQHPRAYHIVVPGGGHGITEVRGGPRCVGGIVAAFVAMAGARTPAVECLADTPSPVFRD